MRYNPLSKIYLFLLSVILLVVSFSGCQSTTGGNDGLLKSYSTPVVEAAWIRNGNPIEFEGELWYPADGVEGLLDSEVTPLGEYQGVLFFVDKVDVRPYDRLYTKFGKNKFRYFKKKDDRND